MFVAALADDPVLLLALAVSVRASRQILDVDS
jgi:hypothetical protein